jgi:hypothetical protein
MGWRGTVFVADDRVCRAGREALQQDWHKLDAPSRGDRRGEAGRLGPDKLGVILPACPVEGDVAACGCGRIRACVWWYCGRCKLEGWCGVGAEGAGVGVDDDVVTAATAAVGGGVSVDAAMMH